jgi:hypothetical protein
MHHCGTRCKLCLEIVCQLKIQIHYNSQGDQTIGSKCYPAKTVKTKRTVTCTMETTMITLQCSITKYIILTRPILVIVKGQFDACSSCLCRVKKGSDHFESYVRSLFLHFCKRLFSGFKYMTS